MPERAAWRHPGERAELVERVIQLDHQVNQLHRILREVTEAAGADRALASYIEALHARAALQDTNIGRLVARIEQLEAERKKAA